MATPPNIHDTFVRSLLADKQMAIDYFRYTLPEHIADKLDFSTRQSIAPNVCFQRSANHHRRCGLYLSAQRRPG
ncbi:MAG: hypothetical protein EAS52_00550 [Parapedobacter sp.]|nr:MAG: hypothetical protein EAS52_00550 [Parapedobacter sp.]